MVNIVTGSINSGKTTRMKALHANLGGDGFIMEKTMDGSQVKSYHAHRLATGETRLLVLRDGYDTKGFKESVRIGPYRFDDACLRWVKSIMHTLVKQTKSPLFLDEVGVLELQGEGFDSVLNDLSFYKGTVYLSVREDLINDIIQRYRFKGVIRHDPGE